MVVVEQAIDVTFPADKARVMLVQPFVELQSPPQEPFPLSVRSDARLRDAIDSAFAHARVYRPNMIVFPEFTIPGVSGVELIAQNLASAEVNSPTIVAGGISGLSKEEFSDLCALPQLANLDDLNTPAQVDATQWVNTSVTFVKHDDGTIRFWVQPKLSPSWPEEHHNHQAMFRGSVVRIFKARFTNGFPVRFFSLLCFDWVGQESGATVLDSILNEYDSFSRTAGAPSDVTWVFVLQHNPAPNHATFLAATHRFLTQSSASPFVRRKDAAVVMACTAAAQEPTRGLPRPYGYSSLVFSPQAPFDVNGCWPTFATQSTRLRGSSGLGTCKDVVFREMGECIHLADVRVPHFVTPDPTDRTPPVVNAETLPLVGVSADPRLPGKPVPAVVKWTNDELDEVPDLCAKFFAGSPIEEALRSSHHRIVEGYRNLESRTLAGRVDNSCASRTLLRDERADPAADVDTVWDDVQRKGLRHVVQTLSLFGAVTEVDPVDSRLHARCNGVTEVVAIAGETHTECVQALSRLADRTHSPIVFVSRDTENAPHVGREAESVTDPRGGTGLRFTDATTLLTAARTKPQDDFQRFIAELVNVEDRRIV